MEVADKEMESVEVIQNSDKYKNVGRKKANELYKDYVKWMKANRLGVVPMKFSEWIKWAANKGIVPKRLGADGEGTPNADEVKKPDTEQVVLKISRTGKIVAWSIIGVTAASLLYYMFKPVAGANPATQPIA